MLASQPAGGLGMRVLPRGMLVALPKLQMRFTSLHGTQVPVLVMLFLSPAEVGHLGFADKFLRRITTEHPVLWRGIHCRDLGARSRAPGAECGRGRCVWQTLGGGGAASSRSCIFHMEEHNPADYFLTCKRVTAIPGRSREELLELYARWREGRPTSATGQPPPPPAAAATVPQPTHSRGLADAGSLVLTPRAYHVSSRKGSSGQGKQTGGYKGWSP